MKGEQRVVKTFHSSRRAALTVCSLSCWQITLAEGGVCIGLESKFLLSVFRMLSSSMQLTLRTIPALRAYIPVTTPAKGGCALQGLVAWNDVIHSLEMLLRHWEVTCATKTTKTAQDAHLVFQRVLLSVVGQIDTPHFGPNALHRPPSITPQAGDIPYIVVTPPTNASSNTTSINMVPTPQDAAFGNLLTVPDPEFAVINACESHEDSYADKIRLGELDLYPGSPFGSFGGNPSSSWGEPEMLETDDEDVTCESWEEDGEAGVLGLGPTWSG